LSIVRKSNTERNPSSSMNPKLSLKRTRKREKYFRATDREDRNGDGTRTKVRNRRRGPLDDPIY